VQTLVKEVARPRLEMALFVAHNMRLMTIAANLQHRLTVRRCAHGAPKNSNCSQGSYKNVRSVAATLEKGLMAFLRGSGTCCWHFLR